MLVVNQLHFFARQHHNRIAVPTDLKKQIIVVVALDVGQKQALTRRVCKVGQHSRSEVVHFEGAIREVRPPPVQVFLILLLCSLKGLGGGSRIRPWPRFDELGELVPGIIGEKEDCLPEAVSELGSFSEAADLMLVHGRGGIELKRPLTRKGRCHDSAADGPSECQVAGLKCECPRVPLEEGVFRDPTLVASLERPQLGINCHELV